MSDSVSAIIVSYSDPEATLRAVRSLLAQSLPLTEVLILDNHPDAPIATSVEDWHEGGRVRLIHTGRNLGYPAACNRGADAARGDWLFFLNPDAYAHPDCVSTLLGCADEATSVVGAQVLLPDGRTNAGDNPVHVTGVAWAGRYGQQREHGPPRQVASVSGAALLARASAYKALGGMCERFFLYLDDVDLCWRVRLAGWQVAFCPEALVWHDYEFDKGKEKWYWLERNRHWTVLANYSPLSLLVLAPMLAGAELMVLGLALRERWVRQLMRAWISTLQGAPELLRWRRIVQASRRASDLEIVARMTGRFQTAALGSPVALAANPLMEAYRRGLLAALGFADR